MIEEWRDVPGYEGRYQISISVPESKCRSLNYFRTGITKELSNKPRKCRNDVRIFWDLRKNSKSHLKQAAYWVAITYPEMVQNTYFEGAIIDHIDGNPLNNHPSNLRWGTLTDNANNPNNKPRKYNKDAEKIKAIISEIKDLLVLTGGSTPITLNLNINI